MGFHAWQKFGNAMHHAPQIHLQNPFPIGHGVFPSGSRQSYTRIVEQQVYSFELCICCIGQCLDL